MISVRDANAAIKDQKTVVSILIVEGVDKQARITRCRTKHGIVQGKSINSRRWHDLKSTASIWVAI
jgi:hypothetical protein